MTPTESMADTAVMTMSITLAFFLNLIFLPIILNSYCDAAKIQKVFGNKKKNGEKLGG
jgi:hypothetical protein